MVYQKDLEMQRKWAQLLSQLERLVGKRPKDLNSVLFLIGVQERGQGKQQLYTKEEKQDLLHIAICKVLSLAGFYELVGCDQDGWPIWKKTKDIPNLKLSEQEKLLKLYTLEYFEQEINLSLS